VNGEAGFAEEFFRDLTVHDDYRLGDVGAGWTVALTTLKHERSQGQFVEPMAGGLATARDAERAAEKKKQAPGSSEHPLIALARKCVRNGRPAVDDLTLRDRIMKVLIKRTAYDLGNRRSLVKGLVDHPMRIPMQHKLVDSEIDQELSALAVEIEGISSNLRDSDNKTPLGGSWGNRYLGTFGWTIAAGTSEIQRNQLGERVLGLAKSK